MLELFLFWTNRITIKRSQQVLSHRFKLLFKFYTEFWTDDKSVKKKNCILNLTSSKIMVNIVRTIVLCEIIKRTMARINFAVYTTTRCKQSFKILYSRAAVQNIVVHINYCYYSENCWSIETIKVINYDHLRRSPNTLSNIWLWVWDNSALPSWM